MPLETLARNIYSLRTDSFAVGVLFFHLITNEFPWTGNNKKEILESYASRQFPHHKLSHLPEEFQTFFSGLC
jgi:hypothetical protein